MNKVKKSYVHPSNFVSNLEKRDKDILIKCAKKRGIGICIEDRAVDGNGKRLKDICAVFSSNDAQDMNDLWIEFNYMLGLVKRGRTKQFISEISNT